LDNEERPMIARCFSRSVCPRYTKKLTVSTELGVVLELTDIFHTDQYYPAMHVEQSEVLPPYVVRPSVCSVGMSSPIHVWLLGR